MPPIPRVFQRGGEGGNPGYVHAQQHHVLTPEVWGEFDMDDVHASPFRGMTHDARQRLRIRYVEASSSSPATVTQLDDYRDL